MELSRWDSSTTKFKSQKAGRRRRSRAGSVDQQRQNLLGDKLGGYGSTPSGGCCARADGYARAPRAAGVGTRRRLRGTVSLWAAAVLAAWRVAWLHACLLPPARGERREARGVSADERERESEREREREIRVDDEPRDEEEGKGGR